MTPRVTALVAVAFFVAIAGVSAWSAPHKRHRRTTHGPSAPESAPAPVPVEPRSATPASTTAPVDKQAPTVDLRLRQDAPVAAATPSVPRTTQCTLCHRTSSWEDVRFDHDRTGFVLKGGHRKITCKACHPINFKARVPQVCAGCHRDPHAAEFGQQCDGCHDEEHWQTNFTVDAHRRTNFPLSGRHAMIPCRECHPNARDRSFSRSPVTCVSCHMADYERAAMTTINHAAAGFSTDCRQCHSSLRFSPARFPDHDKCFLLSGGPHAGIRCTNCHAVMPPAMATGQCATHTAACTGCHEHTCARSDAKHPNGSQIGYECKDQKCYACHMFKR